MTIRTINPHCVLVSFADDSAIVYSYNTPVVSSDNRGNLHRLWSGWSATTQRDINKALDINMNKARWDTMPVEMKVY